MDMTRISYPLEGLSEYCHADMSDSIESLSLAGQECVFDIPANFKYRDYLSGLGGIIGNYNSEAQNIDSIIQKIDDNFVALGNSLKNESQKIAIEEVVDRERMIK